MYIYICIHVYSCVYTRVYVYIYMRIYINTYMCVCLCIYTYLYISVYLYMYVCMYLYISICTFISIHLYRINPGLTRYAYIHTQVYRACVNVRAGARARVCTCVRSCVLPVHSQRPKRAHSLPPNATSARAPLASSCCHTPNGTVGKYQQ